jgi:hypothetical protein
MKKNFAVLSLALLAAGLIFLSMAPATRGQFFGNQPVIPSTNILSDTNFAATTSAQVSNNSPSIAIGSVSFPSPSAHINDGGFGPNATNTSVTVYEQFSLDNINFFNVTNWHPTLTNPVYASFNPQLGDQTIYMRYAYVVTNNGTLGIKMP